MTYREQLVDQALTLPTEDRMYVLTRLQQSLEHEGPADDEIAAPWAVEAERRIAAYERGELQATEWRAAMSRIRTLVAEQRAASST